MMNELIIEHTNSGVAALFDAQSAGVVGPLAHLQEFFRFQALFALDLNADGSDVDVTFKQAQDAGGTGEKAITDLSHVKAYYKTASNKVWAPVPGWDGTGSTITLPVAQLGGEQSMVAIELVADDLDVNNSFDHIGVDCTSSGGTGGADSALIYQVSGSRQKPAHMVDFNV